MSVGIKSNSRPMQILKMCILAACIQSCNWVDSTGRQSNIPPQIEVSVDENILEENQVVSLDSTQSKTIDFSDSIDPDGELMSITEILIDEGKLSLCSGVLDLTTTVNQLSEACGNTTTGSNCKVSLLTLAEANGEENPLDTSPAEQFIIIPPALSSSIGLTYRWTLTDNDGGISTRDITFCMLATHGAPLASADYYQLAYGQDLTIPDIEYADDCTIQSGTTSVLGNDSSNRPNNDCLLAELISIPQMAANDFVADFTSRGGFKYSHNGESGSTNDTFSYRVFDGAKFSPPVDVTLTIDLDQNVAPYAKDDLFFIDYNSIENALFVLRNDSDPENFPLTLSSIITKPDNNGLAKIQPEGYIEYQPATSFSGRETFTYELSDAAGDTDIAKVYIFVRP